MKLKKYNVEELKQQELIKIDAGWDWSGLGHSFHEFWCELQDALDHLNTYDGITTVGTMN